MSKIQTKKDLDLTNDLIINSSFLEENEQFMTTLTDETNYANKPLVQFPKEQDLKRINKEEYFFKAKNLIDNSNKLKLSQFVNVSEISETNCNNTKDENVLKYILHPIQKEHDKIGNYIVRVQPFSHYKTTSNKVYTLNYKLNNLLSYILPTVATYEDSCFRTKARPLITHMKHSSYAGNYEVLQEKIIKNNKNSNSKQKRSENTNRESTTITTKETNRNNNYEETIKKFDLETIKDLEEVKDIELKQYSDNSKRRGDVIYRNQMIKDINNIIISDMCVNNKHSTNRRFTGFDNDMFLTTSCKKLRKKYERSELKSLYLTTHRKNEYYRKDSVSNFKNKRENKDKKSKESSSKPKIAENLLDKFDSLDLKIDFNNNSNQTNDLFNDSYNPGDKKLNNSQDFINVLSSKDSIISINEYKNTDNDQTPSTVVYNNSCINFTSSKQRTLSKKSATLRKCSEVTNLNNNNSEYLANDIKILNNFSSPKKNIEGIKIKKFNLVHEIMENDNNFKTISSNANKNAKTMSNKKTTDKISSITNAQNKQPQPGRNKKNIKNSIKDKKNVENYLTISSNENSTSKKYNYTNSDISSQTLQDLINFDKEPQTIYDLLFYKNLLLAEEKKKKILNPHDIIKKHPKLTWENRIKTLCFMMQMCEEFAFKRDTFHYACAYFDLYLYNSMEKNIDPNMLELIGITCISISAKIEEVQIPKLSEYANSISSSFTIEDIIEMEKKLCLILGWRLVPITINTWTNWYTCQWDLFIDSIEEIRNKLLAVISEDKLFYFKKSNDTSYYNYRRIYQIIDLISLDYESYFHETRYLVAAAVFNCLLINYKIKYDFVKEKLAVDNKFGNVLLYTFQQFVNQSFDYNFKDKKLQNAIRYVSKFLDFKFNFELPLIYQVKQEQIENENYEEFISYQTTNEENYKFLINLLEK